MKNNDCLEMPNRKFLRIWRSGSRASKCEIKYSFLEGWEIVHVTGALCKTTNFGTIKFENPKVRHKLVDLGIDGNIIIGS